MNPLCHSARMLRFWIPPELERLTAWLETMRARPSAKAGT